MKYICYSTFFCLLFCLILSVLFVKNGIAMEQQEYKLENQTYHLHQININMPQEQNEILKTEIQNFIKQEKEKFLNQITDSEIQKEITYTLDITYKNFYDQKYDSYLFLVTTYTGGAHPNTTFWTLNLNRETNTLLTIDSLVEKNPRFLNKVSLLIRKKLLLNSKIVNTTMMMEKTKPIKENFTKVIITNSGFYFFFPPYQIAPYSSGSFEVFLEKESLYF